MSIPYHFNQPKNTACFTCIHVLKQSAPILHVTHDADDGYWQFLCNADHQDDDAMIVGMGEVVEKAPSINALHDMPAGIGAYRDTPTSQWKPYKLQ